MRVRADCNGQTLVGAHFNPSEARTIFWAALSCGRRKAFVPVHGDGRRKSGSPLRRSGQSGTDILDIAQGLRPSILWRHSIGGSLASSFSALIALSTG